MKAVIYCEYGSPDVLKFQDVEKPTPTDTQLLVKIRAAAANPLDWHYIRGTPFLMRLGTGLRVPKEIRLGVDFAGTVEAVGGKVTKFKPGDEVFGARSGAFAQYVVVGEDKQVAPKPANLTFEQVAGVPVAAVTALQGLRDKGALKAGQKVLINGASGGVGTFAVQIAKTLGAEVTGVCSTRNLELVRSLGADYVVDYTKEDFADGAKRYDLILDNVGNRSLSDCRRALTPEGRYVMIGGGGPNDHRIIGPFGRVITMLVRDRFGSQRMGFMLANVNQQELTTLSGLMQDGKVTPVVDRTYKFSELPEAMRYLEAGRARGKVVVTFDE
jgi:NADPH:quinone reductase-like Zn-dependent oxidoreductase